MSNNKKSNSKEALFSSWFGESAEATKDDNDDEQLLTDLEESTEIQLDANSSVIFDDIAAHEIDLNQTNKDTNTNIEDIIMSKTESNMVNGKPMLIKQAVNVEKSTVTSKPFKKPSEPVRKEVKSVDIAITGSTYNVNCYSDEIEDLNKAVDYINDFIRNLRKDAPTLEHENLLVLCCLNMYEEMKQENKARIQGEELNEKAQTLIAKIHSGVDSILP